MRIAKVSGVASSVRAMEPTMERPKPLRLAACPVCKNRNVNAIWYGMPLGDPEPLWPPNVTAGGCALSGPDPNRVCLDCGHEWSTPAAARLALPSESAL